MHEIRSGLDWQDSLNYAVSNCEFFVPLVTPKYGETQWTNREARLYIKQKRIQNQYKKHVAVKKSSEIALVTKYGLIVHLGNVLEHVRHSLTMIFKMSHCYDACIGYPLSLQRVML